MIVPYTYDSRDGRCLTACPNRHITKDQLKAYAAFNPPSKPTEAPMAGSAACRKCECYAGETGQKIDCTYPDVAARAQDAGREP